LRFSAPRRGTGVEEERVGRAGADADQLEVLASASPVAASNGRTFPASTVNAISAPGSTSTSARFTFHFTPTYSSWLNLVERRFAELTTKSIKRGSHRSVRDLIASIRTWIANSNDHPKPFVRHKSADQILESLAAYCQRINDPGDSSAAMKRANTSEAQVRIHPSR
jgi:hypothetical protein